MAERLTFLTGRRLAALVPRDPASVSSADARSSSPDRSVVVVPGSSPASCESNSMNEKESNLQVLETLKYCRDKLHGLISSYSSPSMVRRELSDRQDETS